MIREHEDLVEGDFAFYFPQTDYRDRYRPGGGPSRLTLRRLMVLVDRLPPESAFKSLIEDRLPISEQSAAIGDVIHALTGTPWHRWDALARQRKQAEFNTLLEQERAEARAHNTIYLQAQRAQQAN